MATHCLHIGINDYRGTGHDLAGCVNDARDMQRLFNAERRSRGTRRDAIDGSPFFGRCDSQLVLTDRQATREAVLTAIQLLMRRLVGGDFGVVTFSGHGTYMRDRSGDEPDGYDEAIVCYGLDVVLDDELGGLFEKRDPKSKLLVITDSCHSGTATRSLGPRLLGPTNRAVRHRFLPPSRIPAEKREAIRGRARPPRKLFNTIHLAGCLDDEFCADAAFGGRPRGAFTHYLDAALASLSRGAEYGDLCRELGVRLPNGEFDQCPQVNAYKRCLDWKIPTMN